MPGISFVNVTGPAPFGPINFSAAWFCHARDQPTQSIPLEITPLKVVQNVPVDLFKDECFRHLSRRIRGYGADRGRRCSLFKPTYSRLPCPIPDTWLQAGISKGRSGHSGYSGQLHAMAFQEKVFGLGACSTRKCHPLETAIHSK